MRRFLAFLALLPLLAMGGGQYTIPWHTGATAATASGGCPIVPSSPSPSAYLSLSGDTTLSSGCVPTSSTTAYDSASGGTYNGTWHGTPVGTSYNYSTAPTTLPYAGSFSGSNANYVQLAASPSITTNIVLCAGEYATSFAGQESDGVTLISKSVGSLTSPFNIYYLGIELSGNPQFIIGNGTTRTTLNASGSVGLNTWAYVCGTYDGTTMKIYINDQLDANTSTPGYSSLGTSSSMPTIGGAPTLSPYTEYYSGKINGVLIGATAPTQAQIQTWCKAWQGTLNVCL